MASSAILGFPRIGADRELKKATEAYWAGKSDQQSLLATARSLRATHWAQMQDAGIDSIPSNDFSFYDQVLDTTAMLGAVPARFNFSGGTVDLDTYFAMARGTKTAVAMEMTKWFDTNYHYIVPELVASQTFRLSSLKPVEMFTEAKAAGYKTRPVLVGPLTWLTLGKVKSEGLDRLSLLDGVLAVYEQILAKLAEAGAEAVQLDEPILVTDLDAATRAACQPAYQRLAAAVPALALHVATYFGALGDNLSVATALPVKGLHIDLVRAPEQLHPVLAAWPQDKVLSLGLVDGRNIWRTDLSAALAHAEAAAASRGGDSSRLVVAPSCSLQHVPHDLDLETELDAELKQWLAFAKQKLQAVAVLARGLDQGRAPIAEALAASDAAVAARKTSTRLHDPAVKARVQAVTAADRSRGLPFAERVARQQASLQLPAFPTTTIGSFPQTPDIRQLRARWKKGELSQADYDAAMEKAIADVVAKQEDLDIDVLVHGEFERNDMVEYFGELLQGFAFTKNGWVQSYGSRYVKPPVIFGDVSRPEPMTVRWSAYAKTLTSRPMKGMLTGPVTILMWSFVRDDQPRAETCRQIALAIRDEVVDLEAANIAVIQIDEPAIREGLPLRAAARAEYLDWAVECFRLSASGVRPETQIHTHMCYSEFNDIIDSIAAMDADVISIETSRSQMELLDAFVSFRYPNQIGPGVWDIHSPRVPDLAEMVGLLEKAATVLDPAQLWVNPDCGLKTRGWPEVEASLRHMVDAAKAMRARAA